MMDPTPAELPPGCLVLLLRLSADMTADVVTGRGEIPPFAAERQLADELVEGLVNTAAAGYAVGEIDVAVLGYRTSEDGSPQLVSLLPDGDPKPRLIPLAKVAEMPAVPRDAEGQPRKWTILPPCEGEPCAAAAMERVYQMVSVWLTGRFAARPPVVIHCTGTEGLDEAYFRSARSLGLLATSHGPVRLVHHVFDATNDEVRHLRLLEVSGEFPENAEAGKVSRRALSVNDWDISDQWDALFTYTPREDAVPWAEAGRGFGRRHAMWAQKMGNTPEQWEDAFAVEEAGAAAAVADGASTGIYCRVWADQLCKRFLSERPDVRDPAALNKWVNGLRSEWRAAIDYGNLNWSKKAKVDQVGAAATLLGLELGPADEGGGRPWRAFAVGDACLFWVRDDRSLASFPVVAADQFGSAPLLVRSSPGFKTLAVAAAGTCLPGDRFLLATDAVAARLFKSMAGGPGPEWGRFETISEGEWREELDTLRTANDMVNDDCTLVVLKVRDGVEEPAEVESPAEETELVAPTKTRDGGVGAPVEESAPPQGSTAADPEQPSREEVKEADRGGHLDEPVSHQEQGADTPRPPEEPSPPAEHESSTEHQDGFPQPTDPRP